MTPFNWRNPALRKRFWTFVSVLAVVAFVAHPELRLLLPLIDAIGVDVFVGLVGIQMIALVEDRLLPAAALVGVRIIPSVRAINRAISSVAILREARGFLGYGVFHWMGEGGQRLWFRLHDLLNADPLPAQVGGAYVRRVT
jgi:hypothetical protein